MKEIFYKNHLQRIKELKQQISKVVISISVENLAAVMRNFFLNGTRLT
jgi:hypothetical protein